MTTPPDSAVHRRTSAAAALEFRPNLEGTYPDIYTPEVKAALSALSHLDAARKALMTARIRRRAHRARQRERITFLDPQAAIAGTSLTVADARRGAFGGADIPRDLQRQWIQGTGPAARPGAPVERSIRNVAYALLSGADGWMFDGEDALGQVSTMSLDNQRNLKLALARDPVFMTAAEPVAGEMNAWAQSFFGRPIIDDWKTQLDFTTVIFRARGLHLDDRHVRCAGGSGFSASIVDAVLFVTGNHDTLSERGASVVLYLPKIQTAEEAALWNEILSTLETHLGLPDGTIKVYVLVEQLEACFQLMEIRAALGTAFRRIQHRPVGLHQQRGGCHGLGSGVRQPEYRRHHDDLRLHASLRGSRPTGREYAGSRTAAVRSGREAWNRTSRSVRRPGSRAA